MIGLLEEGIGADRVSDMLLSILADDFFLYTQRIAQEFGLNTEAFEYNGITYSLPHYNKQPIAFVPTEILKELPTALDRDDISRVCAENQALRDRVNVIIGQHLSQGHLTKRGLKQILLHEPELAAKLLASYKAKNNNSYDFEEDPTGELIWKELVQEYIEKYPLELEKESILVSVNKICAKYKSLIEDNGLFKMFHNRDGSHKPESFAQQLFLGIADAYCDANNLDISPESDAGRGPIDFKLSSQP